jgi:hypothetical protein
MVVTNNWIHDSNAVAVWADTNNVQMRLENNLIEDNWGEGFFYEISWNFYVANNMFRRNAWNKGLGWNYEVDNFPIAAIYISESGSEPRLSQYSYSAQSEITGNVFRNNWGDVTLWENADRFCNSIGNTSFKVWKPLGGSASLAVCNNPTQRTLNVTLTSGSPNFVVNSGTFKYGDEGQFVSGTGIPGGAKIREPDGASIAGGWIDANNGVMSANATQSGTITMTIAAGSIDTEPGYTDCRWRTRLVKIHGNTFDHNSSEVVGSNSLSSGVVTGKTGLLSQTGFTGGDLSWSPYGGTVVGDAVTFGQDNAWYSNTYRGDYSFMPHDTGTSKTPAQWQAAPYNQDAGSSFSPTPVSHGTNTTVYRCAPPATCSATPGNGEAKVTFPASTDWGGDAIIGYTVTASPGGATASGIGSPIIVTGLTNNTAYTFTVKARSALGLSTTSSSASNSVTPTSGSSVNSSGPPWQPIKPYAFRKTATSVEVHFFAPYATNGAAITSYTVTASPGGANNSGSTSPITVSGLTTGQPYTFTVTATNSNGTGPVSQPSNSVTP